MDGLRGFVKGGKTGRRSMVASEALCLETLASLEWGVRPFWSAGGTALLLTKTICPNQKPVTS